MTHCFNLTFRCIKLKGLASARAVLSSQFETSLAPVFGNFSRESGAIEHFSEVEAETEAEPRATSVISQDASFLTLPSDLLFSVCNRRKTNLGANLCNNDQRQRCHAASSSLLPTRLALVSPLLSHSGLIPQKEHASRSTTPNTPRS